MKKRIIIIVAAIVFISVIMIIKFIAADAQAFSRIVKEMGYDDVSEKPYEVVEVTIPENFNAVYEKYNAMQKEGGYDLSTYKGKKCKRYTYLIPSRNARANILVYNGKIIGGDISGITLDGIMKPLIRG